MCVLWGFYKVLPAVPSDRCLSACSQPWFHGFDQLRISPPTSPFPSFVKYTENSRKNVSDRHATSDTTCSWGFT